ncbi:unnamed protein product [Heligmosomoides polygyrus]|uniref:Uncharacterized protein n=1 Tax=Heligmosomoides polygyrus TaxID=6339 RepID=A0A183G7P4_HELPZ|nr:unnamed protein product [Heligmosomoides polygyrus]
MRGRLPTIPGCADIQARIKRTAAVSDRSSLQSVDSGVSSLEQATTIASTTSLRSDRIARAWRRQQQRPRSMFDHSPEQSPRRDSMIDTTSFMQITPPPVHRKMGMAGQSADVLFRASRVFVDRSPAQDRRQCAAAATRSPRGADKRIRPKSMFDQADEPLYATPVRAMNREFRGGQANSPMVVRRTAFVPVPSRFLANNNTEQLRAHKPRVIEKNWYESEGL